MTASTPAGEAVRPTLRVRDLIPAYLEYARSAASAPASHRPELWRTRYLDRHPEVFATLDRDHAWSVPPELATVLSRLAGADVDLTARSAALRADLPTAVPAVSHALGWSGDADPVECVVMVGLHRANGWAESLDGRFALFLAVEELDGTDDGRMLVRHEVAHVVHDRLAAIRDWPEHGVANTLLTEGLATEVSAELTPGRGDEAYLWFGRPGHRPWLDECRRRWPEILGRITADLETVDPRHHAAYFLMRDSPLGDLPKRCGYLVGLEVVRQLRTEHPLSKIATWGLDEVRDRVRRALADLVARV
ncbi:hypothetical protein [Micromonospora sp. M61]|uniref:hypothetical protein n=1 Tax=Micromonospora sp. M61 TaxID=2824890 RepID=UPI001B38A2F8|nr:hypothetical protein [Micromonospora sp. M61]MBQ0977112.1 hypothetical protein [Micromonospora sp. M61]